LLQSRRKHSAALKQRFGPVAVPWA
jgi:hypothetical protein